MVNLSKSIKIIDMDVACKGIGPIPSVHPHIWPNLIYQASMKEKGKEIKMNFTNSNGLDPTYYDLDFFDDPNEKPNYLINDENTTIE